MAIWPWSRSRGDFEPTITRAEPTYSLANNDLAVALGWTVPGGQTVNEGTAFTLSAFYRGVSIVAGAVAGLPLRAMVTDSEGRTEPATSWLDNIGGETYTPFELKELVMISCLVKGEIFLQHIYNGAGAITSVNPVFPEQVAVYWDADRPGGKRFEVTIAGVDGREPEVITLDPSTMTQIMGLTLDGLRGISVVAAARQGLSTALEGDRAANRQFSTGASISGLVSPADGEDLTPEETEEISGIVNRRFLGSENSGGIPVINRNLKFTPWTMTAADAQFLESRTFNIDEIGRWLGVPPHLLGLTEKATSWGQGIAEQNRGLARYTLKSWTNRIEDRLTRLLTGANRKAEFDYREFTKPSPEDEINLIIQQVNSGLLTLNEGRARLNLPRLDNPEADKPRFPAGAVPPAETQQGGGNAPVADAGGNGTVG